MDKEKSLIEKKEQNIFSKFINFVKGLFSNKKDNVETVSKSIVELETKSDFLKNIRLEKEEDSELIKLQEQFENNEIDLITLTDEEIKVMEDLYNRQIKDLNQKLDNKKTELNMLKYRKSYSGNA